MAAGGKRNAPGRSAPSGPGKYSKRDENSQPIREPDIDRSDLNYGDRQMLTAAQHLAPLPAGATPPPRGARPTPVGPQTAGGGGGPPLVPVRLALGVPRTAGDDGTGHGTGSWVGRPAVPAAGTGYPRAGAQLPRDRVLRRATERRGPASPRPAPQRASSRDDPAAPADSRRWHRRGPRPAAVPLPEPGDTGRGRRARPATTGGSSWLNRNSRCRGSHPTSTS